MHLRKKLASWAMVAVTTAGLAVGALAEPASAAPSTACSGVPQCRIVASSDIDGDKKADQIGVVYQPDATNEYGRWLVTVRVKTATRTMQTTGRDVQGSLKPFYGVASVDGRRGKEIVVADITGANTYWFRVITYRNGRLVTLKPPVRNAARPARWGVQDSSYFQFGYSRNVSSKGTTYITEKRAEIDSSGEAFTGRNVKYKWKQGKWAKVSDKKTRYSSYKAARRISGWHVRGLPVWP